VEMIVLTEKLKNSKYELLMDYPDRDIPNALKFEYLCPDNPSACQILNSLV